jgi:hypothetical protein
MSQRSGHCLCGASTFTLTADPIAVRVCWCRDCQHVGGNGTVNALVPTAAIEFAGPLSEHRKTADSGNEVTRVFCATCGSHLFARNSARPQFTVVRTGNLEDPSSVTPQMNIWTDSAPGWACIDDSLGRSPKQPVPPPQPISA